MVTHWKSHPQSDYVVSAICELKILYGITLSSSERLSKAYESILKGRFPILAFNEHCAGVYADLLSDFALKGQSRPAFDLMIAATAIANGLELATCNAVDFQNITGLMVMD